MLSKYSTSKKEVMSMFERVRTAIVSPQHLIRFRKDRIVWVFLYMIFFAFLFATNDIVTVTTYDGISFATQENIRQNSVPPEENCRIENAVLECDEETREVLFQNDTATFSIDSHDTLDESAHAEYSPHFVLHDDTLYVFLSTIAGTFSHDKPIAELDEAIHNIDLNYDDEDEHEFFDAVFSTINGEILAYRGLWGTGLILFRVGAGLLLFNVFVLLNAFLIQRRLRKVPFKQMFVMMAYASTLLFVVLIFDAIYRFHFIWFILLLFVAFRQTSRLALEIQRQIQR